MTESTGSISVSPVLPSIGDLVDQSWKRIKEQLPLVIGLSLVVLAAAYALNRIPYVGAVLNSIVSVGYIACLYRIRQKTEFGFKDFLWAFQSFNRFLNVVVMSALSTALTILGLILLVIPGIWLMVALSLCSVLIVKDDDGGVEALQKSRNLVRGHWWYVAGVMLMLFALNILGVLCLGVGVLVSAPVSVMMLIEVTEVLAATKGGVTPADPLGAGTASSSSFAVNP